MRWFKPNLRNSLHAIFTAGLLGSRFPEPDEDTVVSIEDRQQALVSRIALQGVAFDSGERVLQRFLEGLQWKP